MDNNELWVDKHRPSRLADYVLGDDARKCIQSMIDSGTMQNCSFIGPPGSGKTTLAKILCNEFDADALFIPCATEGTVDVIRTKIQDFCNALSFEGKIKIIILDEIDSASSGSTNTFQQALRTLIEEAQSDTRFILTGNYVQKIISPLLSRCPVIPLKYDKRDLLIYVKKVLDAEKIEYTRDSLKAFVEEAFQYYPDCRRIINYLQFCSSSGKLVGKFICKVASSEKNDVVKSIVDNILAGKDILSIRKEYLMQKDKINDYVEAGSTLYNYAIDNSVVVDLDGILKMTDLLYELNMVIDKESGFFGMVAAVAKWASR